MTLYHLYNGILMPGVAHLGFAAYFAIIAMAASRRVLRPHWVAWPCFGLAALALVNGIVGLSTPTGGAFALAPLAVLGFVLVNVTLSVSLFRGRSALASAAGLDTDPGHVGLQTSSV